MKPSRAFLFLPILWIAPAAAQTAPDEPPAASSNAAKAAEVFSLDLPAAEQEKQTNAFELKPALGRYSIDTPILELITDPRAKAVLDKHLPGMSRDKNLDKFGRMSLRQLQPQSGGRLTDALMAETAKDLAAISNEAKLPPGR